MPRLPNRVVFPLSGRATSAAAAAVTGGVAWDYAVAGQVFFSGASEESPFVRATAPFRKDQVDQEQEPGEQTLDGWWVRSQESLHGGSGILFQEDRVSANPSIRFKESMGVDPWTPGQVSMLKKASQVKVSGSASPGMIVPLGTNGYLYAEGANLWQVISGVATAVTWGGTGNILALDTDGAFYYAANSTGIYKGSVGNPCGAGSLLWTISPSNTNVKLAHIGGQFLALIGTKCYDLTSTTGAPTLPAAFLTLTDPGWTWTDAQTSGNVIYAVGYGTMGVSYIWTFTGSLSASFTASRAMSLPLQELASCVTGYFGKFLFVGSQLGLRLVVLDNAVPTELGPLMWTPPTGSGGSVGSCATVGRYVYAGVTAGLADATSGLVRVDPETEVSDGRFAWANDLQAKVTGTVTAVSTNDSSTPLFAITNQGLYAPHATDLETNAYLTTGRIRFRTSEQKLFKFIRVRTDALQGTLAVSTVSDADSLTPVVTYSTQGIVNLDEASLPQVLGPQESIAIKFTFAPAVSNVAGPVLRSYQVKALPAPKRQRIYQLPLRCFDKEVDGKGNSHGYRGFAFDRIQALELAEESGDLVLFQDFNTGESRLCVIDQVQYQQKAPRGKATTGGDLTVVLRAVD